MCPAAFYSQQGAYYLKFLHEFSLIEENSNGLRAYCLKLPREQSSSNLIVLACEKFPSLDQGF
jgi:hypothetical protein